MIRTTKKVRLLEWGAGTNTTNQIWTVIGEGKITKHSMRDGLTTLQVSLEAAAARTDQISGGQIKIAQQGEGMAGGSDRWGEVAVANLKSLQDGGRTAVLEILTATKIDTVKRD